MLRAMAGSMSLPTSLSSPLVKPLHGQCSLLLCVARRGFLCHTAFEATASMVDHDILIVTVGTLYQHCSVFKP